MAEQFFKEIPFFIPKVADSTIVDAEVKVPAVIMDLHHTKWRPIVSKKIKEAGIPLIVDPATVRLLFDGANNKPNFKKLNYGKDITPEALYSDSSARLSKVIEPAITSQMDAGVDALVAPAFHSEDTDDIKFTLNLTLLSETLRFLDEKKINLPVFASINLGKGVLVRTTVRNYIVDMYSGDFKEKIEGYFVTINDLDARKADTDHLLGLSDFVFQLSKEKTVITKHVGGFGEVLSAIGCSGFSSGLAEGETFSTKNLEAGNKGFGRKGSWTYVPEIFDYANDVELNKIGYKCNCKYCNGNLPQTTASKKLHFLYCRIAVVEDLKPLSRTERINFVKGKLHAAVDLTGKYIREYGSAFRTEHLQKWITVLEAAEGWEHATKSDGETLDALLNEIDNG